LRDTPQGSAIPFCGDLRALWQDRVTATFGRVAVLGLGLIGGSLIQAIRHTGLEVVGYDPDLATASAASTAGFPVTATDASAVQVEPALKSLAPHLTPGAVITDVGTLKAPVIAAVRRVIPSARFVGGHPLAGTENTGWAAADPLLFRDAPWALTLEVDTDLDAWLALAELVCDLGAKPVPATTDEQDAAVARIIGLPHVLAEVLALVGLGGGPMGLSLAAGSYMSGSRVARTRPELVATWCDGNAPLVDSLDDVIRRLNDARDCLANHGTVLDLARAGHHARIDWEHRAFLPVELTTDPDALRQLGHGGGWITAVLRDDDGVRLLGMRPLP